MNRRILFLASFLVALFFVNPGAYADQRHGHTAPAPPAHGKAVAPPTAHGAGNPANAGGQSKGSHGRAHPGPVSKPDTQGGSHTSTNQNVPAKSGTVAEHLAQNPALASKLQALLPGTNLQAASAGFRNLGQFVAAVHVSNNLPNITFDQLKAKMVGPNAMSLGQAIQALNPTVNARAEAQRAEHQAKIDLEEHEGHRR